MTDIHEVCKRYGTTSRALRFYEEKGLITSQRSPESGRRQYTEEELANLQNVLILRAIGLPVKTILQILRQGTSLEDAIKSREKEIRTAIYEKDKEIRILHAALATLEDGKDLFGSSSDIPEQAFSKHLENHLMGHLLDYPQTARTCAEYIVQNNLGSLYRHFSEGMMPYLSMVEQSCANLMNHNGVFKRYGKTEQDPSNPNIIYQYLEFEQSCVKIKFVFYGEKLHGIWFYHVVNSQT